jgi:hypothetical protein
VVGRYGAVSLFWHSFDTPYIFFPDFGHDRYDTDTMAGEDLHVVGAAFDCMFGKPTYIWRLRVRIVGNPPELLGTTSSFFLMLFEVLYERAFEDS